MFNTHNSKDHKINPVFETTHEIIGQNYIRLPSADHKNALITDPNYGIISPDECMKRINRMNKDYNNALIKNGYGISREDFKKLDCIDMRNMFDKIGYKENYLGKNTGLPSIEKNGTLTEQLAKLIITDDPFTLVPCFEKGCLQLNKNRWMYWKILELVPEGDDAHMLIKIQDYIYANNSWIPGLYTNIKSNLKVTDDIKITEYNTFAEIYEYIDYSTFHWSEDDMYLWNRYTIKHANNVLREDIQRGMKPGESQAGILMTYYVICIVCVNNMLAKSKLSRGKQVKTTCETVNRKTRTEYTPQNAPKRLIRTIGYEGDEISITSEKTPRLPSEEYVRHYSVASWKVRGTVRHYANGKTVYIKEQVRHRHALKNENSEITPTTIKVSKNADILRSNDT